MRKDRKVQIVTVVVLLAALGIGLSRKAGWRQPAQASSEPQDAIYAMLNAARAGDVKAYLSGYTGQMEATLRQTLAETTETAFAQYLRDSHAAIKGVVVRDPRKTTDREAQVQVEYVYQDRNEVQTMYLEQVPSGWKISRADGEERVNMRIPYGTPMK